MRVFRLGIALAVLLAGLTAGAHPPAPKPAASVTGVLAHEGSAPVLQAKDKSCRLVSNDEEIRETLADKRVAGRTLQVEGRWKNADTFEVQRFLVVRDGRLYKLTYYCDVCNITTYKPGLCVCCQQPTAPHEVPYDPQGIY